MFKAFREFISRGNVVELAVGIIIGAAFGAIVTSLVSDVVMPPLGLVLGEMDFKDFFVVLRDGTPEGPYATLNDAKAAGAVTLNYGAFVTNIIGFLIIALAIFMLVKGMNRLYRKQSAPATPTRDCPYCLSKVPLKATRCAHCTQELPPA
ncbi:MAG: mechanosensitive ion channel protein MscL [Candidatus Coatesbacteria bacterium RBG_13_66_14]|uniref:Large-conductance mechanosensitive channel n=1 Tax=Candidatus Coatesbacteria bacterium RBG_13_66_14 TaxID=1817816 RepID=A0A1F5FB90_9BACT|nr:MAG: mechanosensitive ion channel protein MscL [Candidatus Coatesbacteria bacterium RBG_13_66_14]